MVARRQLDSRHLRDSQRDSFTLGEVKCEDYINGDK